MRTLPSESLRFPDGTPCEKSNYIVCGGDHEEGEHGCPGQRGWDLGVRKGILEEEAISSSKM